mgnify:CR=1 FL=1
MNRRKSKDILSKHVPVEAVEHVVREVERYGIQLRITRGRASKLGDFKPAVNGGSHRISVNGDLNIYAFLLVFAHELAHLMVHEAHRKTGPGANGPVRIQPHGKEWKRQYGELIRSYVGQGFFHPLLHDSLFRYAGKVRASGIAGEEVVRELRLFDGDPGEAAPILLEEIPENSYFYSATGRLFQKGARLRKRYKCLCMRTKRAYLFHPMAKVRPERGGAEYDRACPQARINFS